MAAHLRTCAQLDRQVKLEAASRSIFDPELRRLRASLRAECEAALLADFRLSQKHNVEQLLWKSVFYRPIEGFRQRIKDATGELQDKTRLAFHAYLEDAKAFYIQLALKLQQRLGDAGFPPALAVQQLQQMGVATLAAVEPLPPSLQQDCRAAVHRCLVCLGDLCRYQINEQPAAQRDWAPCRHYYCLAAHVYPEGGNAHNQLAVVAAYEGDQLAAAYHYCRALAAAIPFTVARENLVTHFEQARAASQRLAAAPSVPRGQRGASQALKELRIRCTRLLGMLFTRADLDAAPAQLAAAMADLDDNLARLRQQGLKAATAAASDSQQPHYLVQLATAVIYAGHVAIGSGSGSGASGAQAGPSFAAAAQQVMVRGLALQLLYTLSAKLAAAAAAAAATAQHGLMRTATGVLLLPPLHLLLRWLAAAGAAVVLPTAGEPAELAAARQLLWASAAELVNAVQQVQAESAAASAAGSTAASVVLLEDEQLAGFLPLMGSSGSDSSSNTRPAAAAPAPQAADTDAAVAGAARLQRMLVDAAAIGRMLAAAGGSPAGSGRQQAGLAAAQHAFVEAALRGQEAEAPAEHQQQHQQQQQGEEMVEGEEVILYAPLAARATPSPPPAAAEPARAAAAAPLPLQPASQQQQQQQPPATAATAPLPTAAQAPAAMLTEPAAPAAAAPAAPVPAAAAPAAPAPAGVQDVEMEDALMAETVAAVAGSVLPEDDRRSSPPLAAAMQQRAQQQVHQPPAPAAARGTLPVAAQQPGGMQLPASFFSLLGGPPQQAQQQQQQQQQGPAIAAQQEPQQQPVPLPPVPLPGVAAAPALAAPPLQQQTAAGLRSLLFGSSSSGDALQQHPGVPSWQLAQQPQQAGSVPPMALQAGTGKSPGVASGEALLSGTTAADRWAWMGAFSGAAGGPAPAAATGVANGMQMAALPPPAAAPAQQAQQTGGGMPAWPVMHTDHSLGQIPLGQ